MNNIGITDYSVFPAAGSVSRKSVVSFNENINSIKTYINNITNEEVFNGPIADSIKNGATTIINNSSAEINKLASVPTFMGIVDANYQNSDTTASKGIGGIS